jgi:3-hydroxyisobutyrate dehydrogenase
MIAVLGTGLLGSGFTRAALKRGETVNVYNRTLDKALALEAEGARPFADPAAAIRGVERSHVVLADDAAVDAVLAAAQPAEGAIIVDHSTTSTRGALERTARFRERNVTYLHAPVFMGPQNAAESTGLMLLSGDRSVVAALGPALAQMTGKLVDLGPRVDGAAAFKLLGNWFLMALAAGFTEMLALAKAMNVAPRDAATLFDHFNPGAAIPARFARVLEAAYDQPSWELAMARKDARLMQAEADQAGVALAVLPVVAQLMDAKIAEGFGKADWTVIARDLLR